MILSNPQNTISNDTTRFRVVIAGRRFGKTYLSINEIAKFARYPEREVYYVAPSYRQAKNIVWQKLKNKLLDIRWVQKIYENELKILLKNGSTIHLKGADNYDSLRGAGLDFVVLDEFADIPEEAWFEVLRPALSDKQGHALFIGTPKGKSNWSYDLYNKEHDTRNWKSFQYTTIEGGNVSEEEIEAARLDLDERTFNQEYNAKFENYGSIIAYNFNRDIHVKKYDGDIPNILYVGMDFNTNPITASISIKLKDTLYQIDEIYIQDSNTDEIAIEIKNRYPGYIVNIYPDPACRQRKTSANGNTDYTILQNHGFNVYAPLAHNLIRDRINSINARLKNTKGQVSYYIDPKCKYSIESMEKYSYKDGTQVPDKTKGFDHMFDAITYCVDYLYPIKKDIAHVEQRRFGHRIN